MAAAAAQAAGMTELRFEDDFASLSTIDTSKSKKDGFKWYTAQPYGWTDNPTLSIPEPSVLRIINNQGSINWNMATVNPATGNGFTQARGYFEARLRFDAALSAGVNGWPSFWSIASKYIKPSEPLPASWKEIDFFEACHPTAEPWGKYHYGTLHEWVSSDGKTQRDSKTSEGITIGDLTQKYDTGWHTYGCLVQDNLISWYFDDEKLYELNTSTWSVVNNPDPVAVILGTGTGWPLDVDWVRVWGTPTSATTPDITPADPRGAGLPAQRDGQRLRLYAATSAGIRTPRIISRGGG